MKTISYTRRSLACQYFPDAKPEQAVRRLTSWIRRCRPLYAELTRGGTPFDKRRNLTVREARSASSGCQEVLRRCPFAAPRQAS